MSQLIGTEEKIKQYYNMIYRFAIVQMKNRYDAEDITQETMYRFITKAPVMESEEKEKAWLFQTAMNLCRNIWRASWYKEIGLFRQNEDFTEENPEISVLMKEEERLVLLAVQQLPYKYREVIQLYYYSDMSIREISRMVGRKESTIQTWLARGRERIQKFLVSKQ